MASAILVKAIKPARLKDDKMRLALLNAMRKMGTQVKADFQATTATWKHKVSFEVLVSLKGSGPTLLVGTDDEIYGYVNNGTEPHFIFPKKAGGVLMFKGAYHAKTAPRVIGSKAGGASGPTIAAAYVEHPGTEAREFDVVIAKKWQPQYKRVMEQAMVAAAKASGHSI